MTRKCVADDKYGQLTRRLDEVKRRVDEGTVDYDATMDGLQFLAEGIRVMPRTAETNGSHPYRGNGPGKPTAENSASSVNLTPADGWAAECQRFYQEVFNLAVNFTNVEISAEQEGFGWALYIPKGMTTNQAWAKADERFICRSFIGDDLDKAVPKNDRTSTVAYAKRFRDCVEADEENKNLSANALAKRKSGNITLLERIILELWYHWKTGAHLDIKNVTLCAGSRHSGGDVPSAGWYYGQFEVYYYNPVYANDDIRSRSAV